MSVGVEEIVGNESDRENESGLTLYIYALVGGGFYRYSRCA